MDIKEIIKMRWQDGSGKSMALSPFKPMGYVDNWVVMRRPKCTPILAHVNSFGEGKEYFKTHA